MEKERRVKTLSLVALIVAVLGLTVAFAAMSRTLTINGTANVDAATWDIHFESLDGSSEVYPELSREPLENGNFTAMPGVLSEDSASIEKITVMLGRPGDTVTYNFKIVNDGTIDASITSIINNAPTFGTSWEFDDEMNGYASGTPTDEDMEFYNKYFIYKLTYDTGEEVKIGDELAANSEKTVILTIGVDKEAPSLPIGYDASTGVEAHDGLALADMGTEIVYTQK